MENFSRLLNIRPLFLPDTAYQEGFLTNTYRRLTISLALRGPGGLHQNFLEIDFIVVSDRGE